MKYLEISVRGIIIPEPDNREWCVMAHFILPFVESHLPWLTPSSTGPCMTATASSGKPIASRCASHPLNGHRRLPNTEHESRRQQPENPHHAHSSWTGQFDCARHRRGGLRTHALLLLKRRSIGNARYWRFAPHFPSARELASLEAIGLWVDAANATSICRRGSTSSRGAIGSNPSCRRIRRPARSAALISARPRARCTAISRSVPRPRRCTP